MEGLETLKHESRKHERAKTRTEGNLQNLIFRDFLISCFRDSKLFIPDCLAVSVGDRSAEEVIRDDGKVVGED